MILKNRILFRGPFLAFSVYVNTKPLSRLFEQKNRGAEKKKLISFHLIEHTIWRDELDLFGYFCLGKTTFERYCIQLDPAVQPNHYFVNSCIYTHLFVLIFIQN